MLMKIYLTIQFLMPLLGLYTYQFTPNARLRTVAKRTMSISVHTAHRTNEVGTIATLCSTIANGSALFALKGLEPAFVSLLP
jgi:hypothetical protein